MKYGFRLSAAAAAVASCLVVAGCNAAVAPSATGAAGAVGSAGQSVTMPQHLANVSGDYVGTVKDSQGGTGAAKGTLAQHRADAGGGIRVKDANQSIVADISLTITGSNSTSGAIVVDYPPAGRGAVCTFSATGAYDPTTNVLSGSFTAVTGCSGDTGTYRLTQKCHDTVISGSLPRWNNNPHC
jgi:hypothetical protein